MKSLLAWLVKSRRRFVAATSAIALAGSARLGRRKHGCVGALLGSRLVATACSVVLCGAAGASLSFGAAQDPGNVPCAHARLSRSYIGALNNALSARTDVWGNQLLSSRNGPSYDSAARYLKPLFLAGHMPG